MRRKRDGRGAKGKKKRTKKRKARKKLTMKMTMAKTTVTTTIMKKVTPVRTDFRLRTVPTMLTRMHAHRMAIWAPVVILPSCQPAVLPNMATRDGRDDSANERRDVIYMYIGRWTSDRCMGFELKRGDVGQLLLNSGVNLIWKLRGLWNSMYKWPF